MRLLIILLVSIALAACQSTSKSSGMTSEQLATLICQCAQPIVAFNDNLKSLAADDDIGKLTQEMAKGDIIMKTAENCISDKIMTSIDQLLNTNLNQQIIDQCQLDPRMINDMVRKLEVFNKATFN